MKKKNLRHMTQNVFPNIKIITKHNIKYSVKVLIEILVGLSLKGATYLKDVFLNCSPVFSVCQLIKCTFVLLANSFNQLS